MALQVCRIGLLMIINNGRGVPKSSFKDHGGASAVVWWVCSQEWSWEPIQSQQRPVPCSQEYPAEYPAYFLVIQNPHRLEKSRESTNWEDWEKGQVLWISRGVGVVTSKVIRDEYRI